MHPNPTLKTVTETAASAPAFLNDEPTLRTEPARQRPAPAVPRNQSQLYGALQQAAAFRADLEARAHTPFRTAPGWARGGLNE